MTKRTDESRSCPTQVAGWRFAVGLLLALGVPGPALPWGPAGHGIVGEIASAQLTADARQALAELLQGESLAEASRWADRVREDPAYEWAEPLHYADVQTGFDAFDLARDCPQMSCVVQAIRNYSAVLRRGEGSPSQRSEALRFLIHFVGDIHQPLHIGRAGDRGGNDIDVVFFGEEMNLHAVWDSGMVDRLVGRSSSSKVARSLERRVPSSQREMWSDNLDPVAWANESHRLARSHAYHIPADRRLGKAYFEASGPVVEVQLQKAGVRLGALLNALFGP